MSASMKLTRGRPAKNMQQLASKISDLQTLYQQQVQRRQEEIAHFLSWVDLTQLDDSVLVGAFLFIQNKITTKDPIAEDWQNAGMQFLRWEKSKNSFSFPSHAAPQKTNRSPQKNPESGGE